MIVVTGVGLGVVVVVGDCVVVAVVVGTGGGFVLTNGGVGLFLKVSFFQF